ncbi:MAG: hypothetical protein LC104_17570 [Bacteroidales bacterium]|nr:hypothetical protein [Bacteroidales bacterium]
MPSPQTPLMFPSSFPSRFPFPQFAWLAIVLGDLAGFRAGAKRNDA